MLLHRRACIGGKHFKLPAEGIVHLLAAPLVGHMGDLHLCAGHDLLEHDVAQRRRARGGPADLPRLGARGGQQIAKILRLAGRGAQQQHGRIHDTDYGRNVFLRVKRRFAQMGVECQRADGGKAQGIAIGRCLGHGIHADAATGARLVLNDHRGPQLHRQLVRQRTRHRVAHPTCGVSDDDADGLGGPGGSAPGQGGRGGKEEGAAVRVHRMSIAAGAAPVVVQGQTRVQPGGRQLCAGDPPPNRA
jgi:hypothetical protein